MFISWRVPIVVLAFVLPATLAFAQGATPDANSAATAKRTEEPKPSFEFVDGTASTLAPDASVQFKLDLLIKNSGDLGAVPSLELVSDRESRCDPNNLKLVPDKLELIPPKGVTITHVTISGVKLPATCYIKLSAGSPAGTTSLKQIKLGQQYLTMDVFYPIFASLGLAVIIAIVTGLVARCKIGEPVSPNYRMGSPAWELDKSWISNTTVVSSVLATAMGLGALPELTKYASKTGYAALVFMTSLVVIIAPFLFTAFRKGDVKKDAEGKNAVVYGTCLWLFLLCGAVTLFAGMLQVAVLFLLFDEIFLPYDFWSFGSERRPWTSLNLGLISTVLLCIALGWYVGHSMFLAIRLQARSDGKTGFADDRDLDATAASQRPSWPVL
jgi:hypothetical protein